MANENIYQSEFTGQQLDSRLAAVASLQEALAAVEQAILAKYTKPAGGIPATDLDADVNAALAKANSAIQSLADYYTKSEIDAMMSAVNSQEYETAATLPTASASTMGKIYLIGPDGSGYYSYYFTSYNGSAYSWVGPLGTTEISMANYATKAELNQLDQKLYGGTTTPPATVDGKFIYTNMSVGSTVDLTHTGNNENFHCWVLSLTDVTAVNITGTGGSSGRLWAFIDSSDKLLSAADASATLSGTSPVIPSGATQVIVNINGTGSVSLVSTGDMDDLETEDIRLQSGIDALAEAVEETNEDVHDLDIYVKGIPAGPLTFTEQSGGYYDTDGQYVQHSGLYAEIDLAEYAGQKLYLALSDPSGSSGRATCLMAGGVVVAYAKENDTTFDRAWDIPENAILRESHSTSSTISLSVSGKGPSVRTDAYTFPADFNWKGNPLAGHILKREDGRISVDLDVATLKNNGGVTYYVSPNGNDNNDGLTPQNPLTKISTAIAKADAGTVILLDGVYNINRIPGTIAKSINIIAAAGANPRIIPFSSSSWTKVDGYTSVYKSSEVNVYGVIDTTNLTGEGDYTPYTKVESIADVESGEHAYYTDSTGTYIHATGDIAQGTVYPLQNSNPLLATFSGDEKIYLEGIEIVGGGTYTVRAINSGDSRPMFIAKNCKFGYSCGNVLNLLSVDSICSGCVCVYGRNDGFNYHINNENANHIVPRSIEIDCKGRYNGFLGFKPTGDINTDNGSTSHDGGAAIRVNCEYSGNTGPNVVDSGSGQQSVNIGCVAHHSTATSTQSCGFQMNGTGAEMFCDTCAAYSNDYGFRATGGAIVKMRNCAGVPSVGEGGALGAY